MHTFLDIQRERDQNRLNPLGLASWFQLTAPIIGSPSPATSSSSPYVAPPRCQSPALFFNTNDHDHIFLNTANIQSTVSSNKKPPRCPALPTPHQPRPRALRRLRKRLVLASIPLRQHPCRPRPRARHQHHWHRASQRSGRRCRPADCAHRRMRFRRRAAFTALAAAR